MQDLTEAKLQEELLAMRFCCALVEVRGISVKSAANYFSAVQGWHRGEHGVKKILKEGALTSLPSLIMLRFLAFPMVATLAFRAFSCEDFEGASYLYADYAIDCNIKARIRSCVGLKPAPLFWAGRAWRAHGSHSQRLV